MFLCCVVWLAWCGLFGGHVLNLIRFVDLCLLLWLFVSGFVAVVLAGGLVVKVAVWRAIVCF